ncbi:MAG: DUF6797 domain-containing protein [Planctomycetota bacterium]
MRICLFFSLVFVSFPVLAQTLEQKLKAIPMERLEKTARILGDPTSGALLFHRQEMGCTQCHTLGQGSKLLGPDLSTMGDRSTIAHVVESILDPSKRMERGYESKQFLLDTGEIITGMLRDQTDDAYQVAVPGKGQLQPVEKDAVEAEKTSNSMMPVGLVNLLAGEREFFDLVSFLHKVGSAGPDGVAAFLPEASLITPQPLPAYESDLDHAGWIQSWNDESLKKGKRLYRSICANCHGTHSQKGSLPNALAFASGKFKNGSDPYSMYKTMTHGYAMMLPQRQLVPEQKYQVIQYIREDYLRENNPSQYTRVDDQYLASLPKGTQRGPAAGLDEPWRDMDYGPFLISTYEMVGPSTGRRLGVTPEEQQRAGREGRPPNEQWAENTNFAYKGIGVRLDRGPGGVSRGSHWLAFDHDTMRVAGAWAGTGFIDWHGILFDGRHAITPRTVGQQHFANPAGPGWAHPDSGSFEDPRFRGKDGRPYGPLPREWAHYKGLYKHGDQVVVSYTVGDVAVLESPRLQVVDSLPVYERVINLAASDQPMTMRVAHREGSMNFRSDADGTVRLVPQTKPVKEEPATKSEGFKFDGESHVEIEDGDRLDMYENDFTLTATVQTKQDGSIFAKTTPEGPWVPNGKTLFIRGGRLCYDIGWVGVVQSRQRINDGEEHAVAVRYVADEGLVSLFVDGRPSGSGELKPRDAVDDHIARIGYTSENFPREQFRFKGRLSDVRFFGSALNRREIAELAKGRTPTQRPIAHWNPGPEDRESVRNLRGPRLAGSVVRGESTRESNGARSLGTLFAGTNGDDRGMAWSFDDGHLQLTVPPHDKPIAFTVWVANGEGDEFDRDAVEEPQDLDLRKLTRGGPSQWPEQLRTIPQIGSNQVPFAVDVLSRPTENRWNSRLRMSGVDFFPDGESLVACCCDGDVWVVTDIHHPEVIRWRRIASGLFHPLGIKIVNDRIFVTCRDQIVILNDLNGDGETDYYESFNNDHQVTDHFHEFAMGLQADEAGNLYYAKSARHARDSLVPHHGTLLRVSADGGETRILANGFRAANGVCLNPDGSFFVTDQEGHWTPMNRINRVVEGGFYGNMYSYDAPDDTSDDAMDMPLCWPNKPFDRSPSELLWVDSKKWGPLNGSLLNLSYGYGKIYVVPHEEIDGSWQGGMCRLPLPQFPTGVMRARFHADGQMYACGMHAWGSDQSAKKGGLYRIRATGVAMHLPIGLNAKSKAVEIKFTEPLDPASASDPENYLVEIWSLRRNAGYGSKRYDERTLEVAGAELLSDGQTVRLRLPELEPTWCMQIAYGIADAQGAAFNGVIQNTIYETN